MAYTCKSVHELKCQKFQIGAYCSQNDLFADNNLLWFKFKFHLLYLDIPRLTYDEINRIQTVAY